MFARRLITVCFFAAVLLAAACGQLGPHAPSYHGATIQQAFEQRKSDIQVKGEGVVTRILSDDNEGSRHQRFILRSPEGQTVLISHNIDLAPRVGDLKVGDTVSFFGEYIWNEQGGLIHWTHHDPAGRHVGGWLEHKGKMYQ